jgi:hypothetical protein
MVVPLVFLAIVTVGAGWCGPAFMHFIGYEGKFPSLVLVAISVAVVAAGYTLGWLQFGHQRAVEKKAAAAKKSATHKPAKVGKLGGQPTGQTSQQLANQPKQGLITTILVNKLYFDIVYDKVFVRAFKIIAKVSAGFDRSVIDGAVNGIATLSKHTGSKLRKVQSGKLQRYQRLVVASTILFVIIAIAAVLLISVY